jgi:hypothetical protein
MNIDFHDTERSRPGVVLGLRAAALAGLIVVAGMPVSDPAGIVTERNDGVVIELDLAGHHGSTCCPKIVPGNVS